MKRNEIFLYCLIDMNFRLNNFKYTISFATFLDFSIFYQILLSSQMKRWAIITYKHGIYELPHEFPNDLKLRISKN